MCCCFRNFRRACVLGTSCSECHGTMANRRPILHYSILRCCTRSYFPCNVHVLQAYEASFGIWEQDEDPVRFSILKGNRIQDGNGSYGTVFPADALPYLVFPEPQFAPFYLNVSTGELSFSTAMAPFTPIDYASGPHWYNLSILMNDTSKLGLVPRSAFTTLNLSIVIDEVRRFSRRYNCQSSTLACCV